MRIYGRIEALHGEDGLAGLSEVTFVATRMALRKVAAFLLKQADEMSKHGDGYEHEHLQDYERQWFKEKHLPDVIVAQYQ